MRKELKLIAKVRLCRSFSGSQLRKPIFPLKSASDRGEIKNFRILLFCSLPEWEAYKTLW